MLRQNPKRIRTRTADLSDFLRGNSNKDNSSNGTSRQVEGSTSSNDASKPASAEEDQANTGKARRTFLGLGRTIKRKPSANSSLAATIQETVPGTFPKDFGDGHTVVMIAPPEPSTSSLTSTSHPSQQSLSSKLAARFTPSPSRSVRSRKSNPPGSDNDSLPAPIIAPSKMSTSSLGVPSSPRSISSFDSGYSRVTSESRNTTPTPMNTSTKVTVSLSPPPVSPPELDLFEDLFTQSTSDAAKNRRISTPAPDPPFENTGLPSSLSSVELTRFPEASSGFSDSDVSNSHISQRLWTSSEGAPVRVADKPENTSTPTEESQEWSSAHKRRTLASMPKLPTEIFTGPLTSNPRRRSLLPDISGPPDIPLPNPPPPSPPASDELPKRQRASTLTSIKSASILAQEAVSRVLSSSPTPSTSSKKPHRSRSQLARESKEQSSTTRESSDELRQVVAVHTARFEELSAYLQTLTQQHTAEKAALQKRIDTLEKEARKREKEVKGLRWLVMNPPPRAGHQVPSATILTRSIGSFEQEAGGTSSASTRSLKVLKSRPMDSETEFESANASERSNPLKSSMKVKRNPNLPQKTSSRNWDTPYLAATSAASHRSSGTSSLTPSPASSTSSLPSLTAASTASSGLSAIPETPMVSPPSSFQYDSTEQPVSEKDTRHAVRAAHRISTSSMASLSSVSGATMSYAANLKRSRPPSIAQVLQQQQSGP